MDEVKYFWLQTPTLRRLGGVGCGTMLNLSASNEASFQPDRWLQTIAAISGLFLVLAYFAGRLYLQAYYSAFGVNLSDLDLSLQDVMFQSSGSLLGPVITVGFLLALVPWGRRTLDMMASRDAWLVRANALIARVENDDAEVLSIRESVREQADRQELTEDDASKLIAELDERLSTLHELNRDAEELLAAETYEPSWLNSLFQKIGRGAQRISGGHPLLLVPIEVFVFAGGIFCILYYTGGLASAMYVTAFVVIGAWPVSMAAPWFFTRLANRNPVRTGEWLLILTLTVYLIVALPLLSGFLFGRADRANEGPWFSRPEVLISSEHQLELDWTPADSGYVSPPLLYVGRNADFLVLWNPDTSQTLFVPNDDVRLLVRP